MAKGFTRGFLDLSLKKKVMLFIILIMIPFAAVMVFILDSMAYASLEAEGKTLNQTTLLLKEELINSVDAKAQIFDITFKDMIIDLEELKDRIMAEGFDPGLLSGYYYKHQLISGVYFINSSDSIFISPQPDMLEQGEVVDIYSMEEFGFLSSGNIYSGRWVGPYEDFKNSGTVMTYISVISKGNLTGLVGLDIPTESLFSEIVNIDPSQSSYVFIVRSNGEFISSSDRIFNDFGIPPGNSSILGSSVLGEQEIPDILTSTAKGRGSFTILGPNESQEVASFSSIPSFGGRLVIVSPLDEIVQVQREKASEIQQVTGSVAVNGILYMILLGAFIVLVSYYWADRGMVRPISKLKAGIENLEKTGFNTLIRITGRDEIGMLTDSFNRMAANIRESRKKIEDYSKNLEKKVEERTKELKRKDTLLTKQNVELKKLDKEKDEFISIAAHELKTPLTSIKGFAQLMKDERVMSDKAKRTHYLDLVNHNTVRLYNLILDLVDSSRLSLGKLELEIQDVVVKEIFDETSENMGVIIKEKGIIPEFSMDKGLGKVKADPERLLQILRNLLINAVHFTGKGGRISLRVGKKGGFTQFEVKDTGEGIPKEKQKHIFSRFYQADQSLTRKTKGSGLGLSICKGLVEAMGGKIWFESEEGKGTTFYFTLPIVK